ncbi:MAG: DUF423 domain-containing protein [Verrucomicrobiota bacterium]
MAPRSDHLALRLGAIFGFFGVILGALAAHGPVHDYLDSHHRLDLWRTALTYQWFHALALLAAGQARNTRRGTVIFWLLGVVCFSGSIYGLALDPDLKWLGPITPLGGLFLIAGWGWLWITLLKKPAGGDSA